MTASPVAGEPSVYLPTSVSACQTLASCVDGADETRRVTTYFGNLLPQTVTARNGTGTLQAVQAMTYDPAGNLLSVDGPLTDDTTTFRYDGGRRLVGTISPDPDGGGTLKRRAVRITYRPDSQVSKQEVGTVDGTTEPHWAAFDPAEVVDLGYDANARLTSRKLSSDTGTAYALSQTSYDALGRPECAATRMNRDVYGSALPGACSLGAQGIDGPDRIARTIYNNAGEVIEQQVAVGTADAATEATFTYTSNGKLQTLKDAEGNLTTYIYDGFDRLAEMQYPTRTPKGAGTSDPTDNEQYGYDASGNMTWRRLRDGQVIGYAIDALGRVTWMDLPGGEPDPGFGYDNLGRLISAGPPGLALSFGYDALGRQTGEIQLYGSVTRQFDLAGRLIKLTWHDGFFVDYDRLVTGELSKVRENGATSGPGVLASYGYDNLGRRTSLTRGNGAVTSYGYDPVSRLQLLSDNLVGTGSDQSVTFAYNPAGQIVTRTGSNDSYAWTGHGSGSIGSDANGLNQLHNVGGGTASYDQRGNMTSDPTTGRSFTYGSQNELKSSGTFGLAYDALGRLADTNVSAGGWKQFFYDGVQVAGTQEPGQGISARYVWGDGPDELLVDYVGSGTTNRRWAHQDERGSVIALSDSSGNPVAINRYDEYGRPQSGNQGRFQYTGQMWMPEAGLFHYKNRTYAPHLGKFPQTDPIGYAGGINLYAYVENDPVNWADPLGLQQRDIWVRAGWSCATQPAMCADASGPGGPTQLNWGSLASEGRLITVTGTRRRVRVPARVKIAASCAGVPVLQDPQVQAAALNVLAQSVSANAEYGFFVSDAWRGANWIGPAFTTGHQAMILGERIKREKPSFIGSILTSYWPNPIFIHAHHNNPPPSPVSKPQDSGLASDLGITVGAIDRGGNLTCTTGQ